MTYITTNHRFIIDDKHPSDVFDEMENFFSLYTTAIDDLQQVSVQLSLPASFDIHANKKMAETYRQFTKSLKYTIPDINILPIKTHTTQADEYGTAKEEDNSVILLIQRLDGYAIDDEEKPSLYQSVLGRLIPRFAEEKSDSGLYPERAQISLPEPIAQPTPSISIPQPIPQPVPTQYQSQPAQAYQMPAQQAAISPQRQPMQPSSQPASVQPTRPAVAPVQQPQVNTQPKPQSTIAQQPTASDPVTSQPVASGSISSSQPIFTVLPNIQKSAKPYQDLLTDAIIAESKKLLDKSQVVTQITLKSNDGLTTAMVEQLFSSFHHAHDAVNNSQIQAAHDAIDLVSYGYEVLKPKLAAIGVTLSDEAQFGLKAKVQATPNDIARLQRGEVFSNEIKLGVKLITQTNSTANYAASQPSFNPVPPPVQTKPQNLNQNLQHIVLTIKSIDGLGERQQKVREFPIVFTSHDVQVAHALRLFASTDVKLASGVYFSLVESQGQVLIDDIDPNVYLSRNGQSIKQYDVLMPNDIIVINNVMSVQLLLAK